MSRTFAALIMGLLLLVVADAAQTRANFSGTWRMDESRSGSPGYVDFVGPVVWVIKQDVDSMAVDIRTGEKSTTLVYALYDARPIEPLAEGSSRGHFEGGQLIVESLINIEGKTVTMRQVSSLTNDGREMIVERTVEVEHGYTLRGGQNFSTVKDVFVKVIHDP